jgi:hypothetical protein
MQAKVVGLALAPDGKRSVTLRFGAPDERDAFKVAMMQTVRIDEGELSIVGIALGDVLNVEFTTTGAARVMQAQLDAYYSQQAQEGAPGRAFSDLEPNREEKW